MSEGKGKRTRKTSSGGEASRYFNSGPEGQTPASEGTPAPPRPKKAKIPAEESQAEAEASAVEEEVQIAPAHAPQSAISLRAKPLSANPRVPLLHAALRERETSFFRRHTILRVSADLARVFRPVASLYGHQHQTYGLAFSRDGMLLGANGEKGLISLFPAVSSTLCKLDPDIDTRPALTWTAHSRWVSGMQFVSSADGSPRLISTSDAGDIALWAVTTDGHATGSVAVLPLFQTPTATAGIFSMHERKYQLLTSSKDGTITMYQLGDAALSAVHTYPDIHSGVAKCVRWRDDVTFASCGNDRIINVVDTRVGKPVVIMPYLHKLAINSVGWRPYDEHCLISSSFEPTINVYDIRKPLQALWQLKNHAHTEGGSVERLQAIYHPHFYLSGQYIVTATDKSRRLFFYCPGTGRLLRTATLAAQVNTIMTSSVASCRFAASMRTRIGIFEAHPG